MPRATPDDWRELEHAAEALDEAAKNGSSITFTWHGLQASARALKAATQLVHDLAAGCCADCLRARARALVGQKGMQE